MIIEIRNLSFTYPGRDEATLKNVDLSIGKGEFILLTGPTGCGKSTILKTLNGIIPHESGGRMDGDVIVKGINTKDASMKILTQLVGLVFQSPGDQLFSTVVENEIAFGPENLGLTAEEIDNRIQFALSAVGLKDFRKRKTNLLSGGQQQRIAIASILAMQPEILVLDEPLSQLDPQGGDEILQILKTLNAEKNITIILVEHRLPEVISFVDRIIVMDRGGIVLDENPEKAFQDNLSCFQQLGLKIPDMVLLFHKLGIRKIPLQTEEAVCILKQKSLRSSSKVPSFLQAKTVLPGNSQAVIASLKEVSFSYSKKDSPVLFNIDLEIKKGEILAIMGKNGSGKSTLLLMLAALLRPTSGFCNLVGCQSKKPCPFSLVPETGIVFQNPDLLLFCDSVREEVEFGPKNMKLSDKLITKRADHALKVMTIKGLSCDPPLALSKGQRLRTATASIMAMRPQLLLLDEPTTGQDESNIDIMMSAFKNNNFEGAIVLCTHDVDTVFKYADRVVVLNSGRIVSDGDPKVIFSDFSLLSETSLKPPQLLRISKELGIKPACDIDEVISCLE